ncbi:MAG: hypothetical protein ABI471_02150 [Sphingomonas bacterium]
MTVHDGVQWLCSIGAVGLAFLARDRLRMNAPKVRIALGGVGIILAASLFLAVMGLLPRPWERGFSPFVDATAFAACSLFGALFVMSLIEIGGGTVQVIKRRRYHRRSVS